MTTPGQIRPSSALSAEWLRLLDATHPLAGLTLPTGVDRLGLLRLAAWGQPGLTLIVGPSEAVVHHWAQGLADSGLGFPTVVSLDEYQAPSDLKAALQAVNHRDTRLALIPVERLGLLRFWPVLSHPRARQWVVMASADWVAPSPSQARYARLPALAERAGARLLWVTPPLGEDVQSALQAALLPAGPPGPVRAISANPDSGQLTVCRLLTDAQKRRRLARLADAEPRPLVVLTLRASEARRVAAWSGLSPLEGEADTAAALAQPDSLRHVLTYALGERHALAERLPRGATVVLWDTPPGLETVLAYGFPGAAPDDGHLSDADHPGKQTGPRQLWLLHTREGFQRALDGWLGEEPDPAARRRLKQVRQWVLSAGCPRARLGARLGLAADWTSPCGACAACRSPIAHSGWKTLLHQIVF